MIIKGLIRKRGERRKIAWRSYKHYIIDLYFNVVKKDTIEFEVEVYSNASNDYVISSYPTLEEAVELYNNFKG